MADPTPEELLNVLRELGDPSVDELVAIQEREAHAKAVAEHHATQAAEVWSAAAKRAAEIKKLSDASGMPLRHAAVAIAERDAPDTMNMSKAEYAEYRQRNPLK